MLDTLNELSITCFCFYKMSRIGKSIRVESIFTIFLGIYKIGMIIGQ